MALIDVIVHFGDSVVAVDDVRIADVECAREVRIRRDPFPIARDCRGWPRCSYLAAGQGEADLAYRKSRRYHAIDGIQNAVCWVVERGRGSGRGSFHRRFDSFVALALIAAEEKDFVFGYRST